MSFAERLEKLDREVAVTVGAALAKLRAGIAEHLRSGHEEALRRLSEIQIDLPGSFVASGDLEPEVGKLEKTARTSGHADLKAAFVALDQARSQADTLGALTAEALRFASRAAVLLVRPDVLSGWGGSGFGTPDWQRLSLPRAEGFAARLGDDGGAISLSAADCALVTGPLAVPAAQAGAAVPLVLRDRLAAVLYADVEDGEALSLDGLQALAYAAALAIETLPFRDRPATATLRSGAASAEPPAAAATPEAATPTTPEAATPEATSPAVAAEPVAEAPEAAAQEEPAAEAQVAAVEPADEPAIELPPVEEFELPATAEPEIPSEPISWQTEPDPAFPHLAPALEPEPPAAAPSPAASGHETVLLRTVPEPEAAPPAPDLDATNAEPLHSVPASDGPRTAEVRPPSGVQGPGWAFSTGRIPAVAAEDEAIHEEARRLARLLVSEIKLYNEEQVEEGRRNRDLYERLKEDIDRSRQMYEERVDPRLVTSTDYFYQELVRILGGGDSRALGI